MKTYNCNSVEKTSSPRHQSILQSSCKCETSPTLLSLFLVATCLLGQRVWWLSSSFLYSRLPFPSPRHMFCPCWVNVDREWREKRLQESSPVLDKRGHPFSLLALWALPEFKAYSYSQMTLSWAIWIFYLLGFLFCKILDLQKMIFS